MKNFLVKIGHLMHRIYITAVCAFFYLCPVQKNKIVCFNFRGDGFGDSPKYLVNELLKKGHYAIYWVVKDLNMMVPAPLKKIKYQSLKMYYHLITARLRIDNIRCNPKPPFKRKNQFYLQTDHGGMLLKGVEKDVEQTLGKWYVRMAKQDGKLTDFMLSNCASKTAQLKTSYWYDGEIWQFGLPREDILFHPDQSAIDELKIRYNLQDKKIVLYAPSFRDDRSFYDRLHLDPAQLTAALNQKFGGEFVFCTRVHPNDLKLKDKLAKFGTVDLTAEGDSMLVLAAADVVISDYSSMLIDFVITQKPAFCFAPDYEQYIKNERILYLDLQHCGLPFAESFPDLLNAVKTFDATAYQKVVAEIFAVNGLYPNHGSAQAIVDHLLSRQILCTPDN